MPIHAELMLNSVSDSDFAAIDEAVIRAAYATQNKFGRLFDERVYENDLACRLRAEGYDVHTQVPVRVAHGSFQKSYFLDLVVNHMLYEVKAVSVLLDEHKAQALNYAMLQDIRRVKLLNFGEPKVRGQLLLNAVSGEERYQPRLRKAGWRVITPQCEVLLSYLRAIIKDWGTHLSSQLYNEALVHHFGGETHCLQRIDVKTSSAKLGTHLVQMHGPNHAFTVTALTRNQTLFRKHIDTLLAHTDLQAIQWINLNHARVEITTVENKSRRTAENSTWAEENGRGVEENGRGLEENGRGMGAEE
jgi:GxxExxY protein